MTTEQALLASILADPANNQSRLILADWWEENGQAERAEFVRVQIQLAEWDCRPMWHSCGPTKNGSLCQEFRRREDQLIAAHKWKWLPDVVRETCIFGSATPEKVADGIRFERGFIGSVGCGVVDWLRHGPEAASAAPITRVRLTDRVPAVNKTTRLLWFKRRRRWGTAWHPSAWDVPPEFWPWLPDCGPGTSGLPTMEAAMEALSAAAVAWAREMAGLPALRQQNLRLSPIKRT